MSAHLQTIAQGGLGLAIGAGIGASFHAALRVNVGLYLTDLAPALGLHAARFALTAAALVALASLAPAGLIPALLAFTIAGLVAARRAAVTTP